MCYSCLNVQAKGSRHERHEHFRRPDADRLHLPRRRTVLLHGVGPAGRLGRPARRARGPRSVAPPPAPGDPGRHGALGVGRHRDRQRLRTRAHLRLRRLPGAHLPADLSGTRRTRRRPIRRRPARGGGHRTPPRAVPRLGPRRVHPAEGHVPRRRRAGRRDVGPPRPGPVGPPGAGSSTPAVARRRRPDRRQRIELPQLRHVRLTPRGRVRRVAQPGRGTARRPSDGRR